MGPNDSIKGKYVVVKGSDMGLDEKEATIVSSTLARDI